MTAEYKSLHADISTGIIDSNRNTLIQKTKNNKGKVNSFEERIFWLLNEN